MLALFLKFVPQHLLSKKEASGPGIFVLNTVITNAIFSQTDGRRDEKH